MAAICCSKMAKEGQIKEGKSTKEIGTNK